MIPAELANGASVERSSGIYVVTAYWFIHSSMPLQLTAKKKRLF